MVNVAVKRHNNSVYLSLTQNVPDTTADGVRVPRTSNETYLWGGGLTPSSERTRSVLPLCYSYPQRLILIGAVYLISFVSATD